MNRNIVAAIGISLALGSITLCSQIAVNGSFESPSFGSAVTLKYNNTTSNDLTGWNVFERDINVVIPANWQTIDGTQSIDLNGEDGAGAIVQPLSNLIPNENYQVKFLMARNVSVSSATLILRFGSESNTFVHSVAGATYPSMKWQTNSAQYTPVNASVNLIFQSAQSGSPANAGPALDRVVVRHGS